MGLKVCFAQFRVVFCTFFPVPILEKILKNDSMLDEGDIFILFDDLFMDLMTVKKVLYSHRPNQKENLAVLQ